MRTRNFILSLSFLLLGVIFLAGSTGITLIIHNCPVCHQSSAAAGIYLSPEEPEDHCCDAAEKHCASGIRSSMESSCCHFKIEKLRLTDYSPAIPLMIMAPAGMPFSYDLFNSTATDEFILLPHDPHNKHGGRYMLTRYCQFIS